MKTFIRFVFLIHAYSINFCFSQNYYQVPGAIIQPQFAAPLYFKDGNGNRDTLFFGYDNKSHLFSQHTDSDTLFGCKKTFVDTNTFYVAWGYAYVWAPNNKLLDSIYKVSITPFGACPMQCFPSTNEIFVNKGILPLTVSWDISTLRNDSVPFLQIGSAPRGQAILYWDFPVAEAFEDPLYHLYGPRTLVTDTFIQSVETVKDSIVIYNPLGTIEPTSSGYIYFYIKQWDGLFLKNLETLNHQGINIFPNPTSDLIFINSEYSLEEIEFYDSFGHLLEKENNHSKEMVLNVNKYENGIYFVKIFNYKFFKIIVSH